MFQALSIFALLAAIGLPLLDYTVFRPRRRALRRDDTTLRGIERIVYVVFLVALAGMVLSSIMMLAVGERMHRWMLIVHMSLAPLFAVCIAGLALLWAELSRFTAAADAPAGRFATGEKIAFWIVLLASFVTILSAMLAMMPWFGSDGQEVLLNVHRASALALLVAAAYQAGRLLVSSKPSPARQ